MDKNLLKKLAEATIINGTINETVANYALGKLSNHDLKQYDFHLKQLIIQSTVLISTPQELDEESKNVLEKKYAPKSVKFVVKPNLGGGLVIRNNDDVIDASVKGMIQKTVKTVEESL